MIIPLHPLSLDSPPRGPAQSRVHGEDLPHVALAFPLLFSPSHIARPCYDSSCLANTVSLHRRTPPAPKRWTCTSNSASPSNSPNCNPPNPTESPPSNPKSSPPPPGPPPPPPPPPPPLHPCRLPPIRNPPRKTQQARNRSSAPSKRCSRN